MSVGQDNDQTHCLWKDVGGSWSRVEMIARAKCDQNIILFSLWLEGKSDKYKFVSGGGRSIQFWQVRVVGARYTLQCYIHMSKRTPCRHPILVPLHPHFPNYQFPSHLTLNPDR